MTKVKTIRQSFIFYGDALDYYFDRVKEITALGKNITDFKLVLEPDYHSYRVCHTSIQ